MPLGSCLAKLPLVFILSLVPLTCLAQAKSDNGRAQETASKKTLSDSKTSEDLQAAIKSIDGLIVVWNESKAHFTLELKGEKLLPQKVQGIGVSMDGFFVQIIAVANQVFASEETESEEILEKYRAMEHEYWEKRMGFPMPTNVVEADLSIENYSFWEIEWSDEVRKKHKAKTVKNLFLTIVVGDHTVAITHPVMEDEDEKQAIKYLQDVGNSLVIYDQKVELKTVREQAMTSDRADKD